MDLFIYSDESGVFDHLHEDYFVFAGIICIGKDQKDENIRKYKNVEKILRQNQNYSANNELKASILSPKDKGKIFRSLNNSYKFAVIIYLKEIKIIEIFSNKKSKQRYLDYAYKIAVKRALINLLNRKVINKQEIENIYFYVDEHTTATNGRYELKEAIEQELKIGTFNYNYNYFYAPVFPDIKAVQLQYCNSQKMHLVRAADIIANKVYYCIKNQKMDNLRIHKNMYIIELP
ncbi:MAG: DUF3800 domain-containing protein [Succinivibrio sp.]